MDDLNETRSVAPAPETPPATVIALSQDAIDALTRVAKDAVAAALADITRPDLIVGDVLKAIEPELKPLLKSKTLWALAIAAAALVAQHLGHPLSATTQGALIDNIETVVQGVGLVFAAIFRITGSKRLG
jgi:hypothetical protein